LVRGGQRTTPLSLTKEFEGPNSTPWNKCNEVFVTHNNAALIFGNSQFKVDIVT